MAEANGHRTHAGPYQPHTGFEDQGHHQAPVTSAKALFIILSNTIILNPFRSVNEQSAGTLLLFDIGQAKKSRLALFGFVFLPRKRDKFL